MILLFFDLAHVSSRRANVPKEIPKTIYNMICKFQPRFEVRYMYVWNFQAMLLMSLMTKDNGCRTMLMSKGYQMCHQNVVGYLERRNHPNMRIC